MTAVEFLLGFVALQLVVVNVQLQRLIPILRNHVIAGTRTLVYVAKLAALFKLSPPTERELADAQPKPRAAAAGERR